MNMWQSCDSRNSTFWGRRASGSDSESMLGFGRHRWEVKFFLNMPRVEQKLLVPVIERETNFQKAESRKRQKWPGLYNKATRTLYTWETNSFSSCTKIVSKQINRFRRCLFNIFETQIVEGWYEGRLRFVSFKLLTLSSDIEPFFVWFRLCAVKYILYYRSLSINIHVLLVTCILLRSFYHALVECDAGCLESHVPG